MDSVFTMVVLIVAISCGAGVINNYLKTKRSQAAAGLSEDAAAQLDQLRERVEVLEQIVTDERFELNREIARLEDAETPDPGDR